MLHILIDGREAVIKKDTSIELAIENRKFSSSDSYSLNISFPLKDCVENMRIFGLMHKRQVRQDRIIYKCVIQDSKISLNGSILITEISDTEVKGQFLEGRSGNSIVSPIADVYINELQIASPSGSKSATSPAMAWSEQRADGCVALPWISNSSGIMHNKITYKNSAYSWHEETSGLSWMPYLWKVIEGMCECIGYSCDISYIKDSVSLKYLLVCNSLPYAWNIQEVAKALPHWSVEEFFKKLEKLIGGEFRINHNFKSVVYVSDYDADSQAGVVEITAVNEFTADVTAIDTDCKSIDVSNIKYKEQSHEMQKFYSCDWLLKLSDSIIMEFENMDALMSASKSWIEYEPGNHHRGQEYSCIYHVKDIDAYFCQLALWKTSDTVGNTNTLKQKMTLQRLNEFGHRIISDSEDWPEVELDIVPACVMVADQDYWHTLFLDFSSYSSEGDSAGLNPDTGEYDWNSALAQVQPVQMLEAGEKEKKEQFYDCIYLGWWDGKIQDPGSNPFPNVSSTYVNKYWPSVKYEGFKFYSTYPFSLSLKDKSSYLNANAKLVDTRIKYNIKFLADFMPNIRSVFIIDGQKYVCEKLTMTLRKSGFSKLVKGVFWRVKD